ncbi:MAG: UDP-2,3-diacylglucosamine diphosphatase [Planctomycetes bacterium]|nr:UDP-2,3-diacylglucosamine diphosphatase [Planctomycetota bacterium]
MAEFDAVLFSDLHLSPKTPAQNRLFDAFVERVAGTPEVACLGDLTEYWIGYHQLTDDHGVHVIAQLAKLARGTKRAIFVGGNRDFLMRPEARSAGFETFKNVYEGEFAGRRVALEHGDRFCSLDRKYQRFRWWFRKVPWWIVQAVVTASQGHRIAQYVRRKSKGETARRNPSMFGMQPKPIERLVARGAEFVIAGHVHFPFSKEYASAGKRGRLMVMSDWRADEAVVCVAKNGQFELRRFNGVEFLPFDAPAEQVLTPAMAH